MPSSAPPPPADDAESSSPHDAAWYAHAADRFGYGPGTARLDPERARWLDAWCAGRVLDVGCATGIYVDHLARRGLEAEGLDHAEELVAWAKANRRGRFTQGDLYALPYPEGAFDTVMALDVLEHVEDERAYAELRRVARERIVIGVPAETDADVRAAGLLYAHHEDPSHRRVYDEVTLRRLVERDGWMVEALEGIGAVDWNGLLLSMVQHERPWKRRLAHKMIFKALRHVPPRRCPTGWMALLRRGA